jgi:hypothetical protein
MWSKINGHLKKKRFSFDDSDSEDMDKDFIAPVVKSARMVVVTGLVTEDSTIVSNEKSDRMLANTSVSKNAVVTDLISDNDDEDMDDDLFVTLGNVNKPSQKKITVVNQKVKEWGQFFPDREAMISHHMVLSSPFKYFKSTVLLIF